MDLKRKKIKIKSTKQYRLQLILHVNKSTNQILDDYMIYLTVGQWTTVNPWWGNLFGWIKFSLMQTVKTTYIQFRPLFGPV